MKRFLVPLTMAFFVAPPCYAENIFKCTTEAGVSFQSTPCAEGGAAIVLAMQSAVKTDAQPDGDAPPAVATATVSSGRLAIHSRRDELQPGMSDLQVLNNRRWGKPQRISRSREAGAWHEFWNYETGANGGKQLHFVNGMLAAVKELYAPTPVAGMVPAVMRDDR